MKSLTVNQQTAIDYHKQAVSRYLTSGSKNLTVEGIVRDGESVSFRSITHRSTTDFEKQILNVYRVGMADAFMKGLRFLKTGITWEKDMIIEFVDEIVAEFPNWKPEDFFLFVDMMKKGKFGDKYEQTIDFPILMRWAHDYDDLKLRAIESERVVEIPEEPFEPDRKYTEEEVKRLTDDLYQMLRRKSQRSNMKNVDEPEDMRLQRMAFNAYRRAQEDFVMTEEVPENNLLREAARQQFEEQNPVNEWCQNWIQEQKEQSA